MHFPHRSVLPVWAFLVAALVASPAVSGTLNDFETDAAGREKNKSKKEKEKEKTDSADAGDMCLDAVGDEICSSLCASSFIEDFIKNAGGAISQGGSNSLDRINPGGLAAQEYPGIVRKRGEALIPFLRADAAYQEVESDVTAWDYRFELGYGSLGFQFRYTAYNEKEPPDALRVSEYHVLYRMSATPRFEIDLGVGGMFLSGNQENSGFSVTVPVLYHPTDFYGFEFRPVWSSINENDIQDFDLAVLFGWRYASIKAGYRWLRSPHQSLDGPEIGIALRW